MACFLILFHFAFVLVLSTTFFLLSLGFRSELGCLATDGATERELFDVWVVHLQGTAGAARTHRERSLRLAAQVVARHLPLVTHVTEMGLAPAEPTGHVATELALELDELGAVLGTGGGQR